MAYKNWTLEEESLLRQLAQDGKHSYRDMERFFPGRSLHSLTCHARQYLDVNNDVYKQHKYTYDETFFREPNPLNGYIAGFLAADGSIGTPIGVSPTLRLEIAILDLEHLKMIKRTLGYTGVISPGGCDRGTFYFKITVSQDYIDDLALNFGVIPRKTHHLTPPNLKTPETRLAFLAGLLDGDGCVHVSRGNKLSISYISSSIVAVEWYMDTVCSLRIPSISRNKSVPHIYVPKHVNAYRLTFVGAKAVALVKVMQALKHQLGLPLLDRKWDNPRLNSYIADFESRFPAFHYDAPVFVR